MSAQRSYEEFLESKSQLGTFDGFDPLWMPDFLFDFQKDLVDWSLRKGKAAIFADCGMGKTPIQLVWAQNIVQKENKPVLILTPLAVSAQTIREGAKFGIEVRRTPDNSVLSGINVSNYERLHHFNPNDFCGVVCDESSILKNYSGAIKGQITEFMKKIKYRTLCTATAAPNDYNELGTSSEALGDLGCMDMLNKYFRNTQNNSASGRMYGQVIKWRLKGHAEEPFWRWICSWARAIRKPSDMGYDDRDFILPALIENEHVVESRTLPPGMLFPVAAVGLKEQREERRRTIMERCEKVLELTQNDTSVLIWGHLNDECNMLEKIIPDSRQVKGDDSEAYKEETFQLFADGKLRALISKPRIGAFGMNFQNCSHITFFASHSYEQYYQGVRRCWRFGQKNPVTVDVISSFGEIDILKNIKRKAQQADRMFDALVKHMNNSIKYERKNLYNTKLEVPSWL